MRLPELDDGRPVYRQIADHVRGQIRAGALAGGERLPTIRALADRIGVNRDTVAQAYESLITEGLLTAVVGSGTFVRAAAVPDASTPSLRLSPHVDWLLAHERSRPRFGSGENLVPLHSLIPDPDLYPIDDFRRAFDLVVAEDGAELFSYGGPEGHPRLRAALARRFRDAGMGVGPDEIVLCHGASQGISLAVRLFAGPDEYIAVEEPTYANVLSALYGLGLRAAAVPMDDDGPEIDALTRTLARPDVRAFYTIPAFHNPRGTTMSDARRHEVIAAARAAGKPIIEDAFEMDLHHDGKVVRPLFALDDAVVHLFSFSKSLFPGVRVGSITARGPALEGLLALKRATDLSDSMPIQAALAKMLDAGDYDRHLARLRPTLRARREALLGALAREMPAGTTWTKPEGGYQVWVELGFPVDTRDLLADATRAGVLFAPGSQFRPDGGPSRAMRLTVAQTGVEQIERGVAALAKVIREHRDASPAAGSTGAVHV
jgi:DNA-binding transcriptional MocR family regulator